MSNRHLPSDCPHVSNEREVGELCATVSALSKSSERLEEKYDRLDQFLREHMRTEEEKFDALWKSVNSVRLVVARWLGGGIALMIASDWIMRSGLIK